MNAALLALLLVGPAAPGTGDPDPERMTVVVHTVDGKRTIVRCLQPDLTLNPRPSLGEAFEPDHSTWHVAGGHAPYTPVREPGRITWHVSGGRAPYVLVRDERDLAGNVCITVRDADGREATGCGILGEQVEEVVLNCGPPGTRTTAGTGAPAGPAKKATAAPTSGAADPDGRIVTRHRPEPRERELGGERPRGLTQQRPEQGPRGGGSGERPVGKAPLATDRR
ncbi:MAG: hypothetical protein JNJ64_02905 [Flavobacteriales bacterium]|nr:hypothetical protein [Flavobacteriales bacterium]